MTDTQLPPHILHALEVAAEEEQRSVADVLADLVQEYVARRHDAKIAEEFERFVAQHAELATRYLGEYIAMYDGQVMDHDPDPAALHQRVRSRFGYSSVLITLVSAEPLIEFQLRSPRLEQ